MLGPTLEETIRRDLNGPERESRLTHTHTLHLILRGVSEFRGSNWLAEVFFTYDL